LRVETQKGTKKRFETLKDTEDAEGAESLQFAVDNILIRAGICTKKELLAEMQLMRVKMGTWQN